MSGPSQARIVLRDFDLGRTPAEAETDANAGDQTESQPQSYYDRAQTVASDTAETVTETPAAKKYTTLPGYTLTAPAPQNAAEIRIQVTA